MKKLKIKIEKVTIEGPEIPHWSIVTLLIGAGFFARSHGWI